MAMSGVAVGAKIIRSAIGLSGLWILCTWYVLGVAGQADLGGYGTIFALVSLHGTDHVLEPLSE